MSEALQALYEGKEQKARELLRPDGAQQPSAWRFPTPATALAGALRQLETAREISAAQDETLRLVTARQRVGLATAFDVERAQIALLHIAQIYHVLQLDCALSQLFSQIHFVLS